MILEMHRKFGNKWSEIAKFLPGRTDNSIKNRFNSTLKRRKLIEESQHRIESELQTPAKEPLGLASPQNEGSNSISTSGGLDEPDSLE